MINCDIVIRVDGNSVIGLGHVYRGIALAEVLKDDFVIKFVTKCDSIIAPIREAKFDYLILPETISFLQEAEWFKQNLDRKTIIIIDGYDFNEKYQVQIKKLNFKLIYVDDLMQSHIYADLVINHSLGISESDYKSEPYTEFALGTDYALLRPSFLKAAKQNRFINKVDTAFVCFGGADNLDLSYIATLALLEIEQIEKINVVLGSAYQHEKILKLQKQNNDIHLHRNLSEENIIEVMQDSNFGIVPSSTILFELCSIKMPILSGYYVDNQRGIYKNLYDYNAIFGIGDFKKVTINNLVEEIKKTLEKVDFSIQLDNQQRLFDGKTKERIVKMIKKYETNCSSEKGLADSIRMEK